MIYTVEIGNGYIGTEIYYLCHRDDYLESLCYNEDIIYQFINYVGSPYPSIEEIMNDSDLYGITGGEYQAEEILYELIVSNVTYDRTPATLMDLNNLSIIPDSCICEESDDFILYKSRLSREDEINKLLK